jgi:hypothetical protein
MAVPCEGHEHVGYDEEKNGFHWRGRGGISFVYLNTIIY